MTYTEEMNTFWFDLQRMRKALKKNEKPSRKIHHDVVVPYNSISAENSRTSSYTLSHMLIIILQKNKFKYFKLFPFIIKKQTKSQIIIRWELSFKKKNHKPNQKKVR